MSVRWAVRNYDLGLTLTSGQAFRWEASGSGWRGIVRGRWVLLRPAAGAITAEFPEAAGDTCWLSDYLQIGVELEPVLAAFPHDGPMRAAVRACRGLRLLRQEPWECLASFILSSTKRIVQIRQIVERLCERFGEPVIVPAGHPPQHAFPTAARLARSDEKTLRECRMGFRAAYLLEAARAVAAGELDLAKLGLLPVESARARLMALRGVGRKIADCVLLFAYGYQTAFPVDVWVMKALRQLYFPGRRVSVRRLREFSETHFGRFAGYAQQYLFHYIRTRNG
jgi:N-glycosylase/DNA lyase